MGRSVPWVLSKDLRGHSCPGVCLSQEAEGHLETGARVIFSALSLHPVSKRGMENCVPGGCDPANTQATFLGPEGEFPFCGGRGLVDPDAGCLSVCLCCGSDLLRLSSTNTSGIGGTRGPGVQGRVGSVCTRAPSCRMPQRNQEGTTLWGARVEGLGLLRTVTASLGSSTEIWEHIQPQLGDRLAWVVQTLIAGTGLGVHLIWYPKPRSKADR